MAAAATALPTALLTYDFGDAAETAAVRALAGEIPVVGTLPVGLSDQLPVGIGTAPAGGRRRTLRRSRAAVLDLKFRNPRALSSVG